MATAIALPSGKQQAVGDSLPFPYLLFLGDTIEPGYAKTAFGLRDWARDRCVGELSLPGASVATGLPNLTLDQALEEGARALVIGVANPGGIIPQNWVGSLSDALEAGFLAEDFQAVVQAGADGLAGGGHADGVNYVADLDAFSGDELVEHRFQVRGVEGLDGGELCAKLRQ